VIMMEFDFEKIKEYLRGVIDDLDKELKDLSKEDLDVGPCQIMALSDFWDCYLCEKIFGSTCEVECDVPCSECIRFRLCAKEGSEEHRDFMREHLF